MGKKNRPAKLTATIEDLVELLDTVELDFEEMQTFDELGVDLSAAADGQYPWTMLAALVWVKARREGHPGISWADARSRIRLPLA